MRDMRDTVLQAADRKALLVDIPEIGPQVWEDGRHVTLEKSGDGWLLKTHIKTACPDTQFVYDSFTMDAQGNIPGLAGKTVTYVGHRSKDAEMVPPNTRHVELLHYPKASLGDHIIRKLFALNGKVQRVY